MKCLVTNLDVVINNDNLRRDGEVVLNVKNNASQVRFAGLFPVTGSSFQLKSDGTFSVGGSGAYNEYTVSSILASVIFSNATKVKMYKAEDVKVVKMEGMYINLNDIVQCSNLLIFEIGADTEKVNGDISVLPKSLRDVTLSGSAVSGSIESLDEHVILQVLKLVYTSVVGEIQTLAAAMAQRRTSGSLAITCNGIITNGGTAVGNGVTKTITFSNGSYTIS